MENSIRIFRNLEDLSLFFVERIKESVRQIPPDRYFTIALSGGSTPRKVFEYIALHYKDQINWNKILVFWSDERCVGPESDESNYRMAKESLLDLVPIPAHNIFRIHGESDPNVECKRYERIITQNVHSQLSIPQFDLMMLGLGDDGHTVSVFPGNLPLFNSNKLCEVAENPDSKQKRITLTGKLINRAKIVIFLVTGESKAEMVARIIEKKKGSELLPATLVQPRNGKLFWLLDELAASKLNSKTQKLYI